MQPKKILFILIVFILSIHLSFASNAAIHSYAKIPYRGVNFSALEVNCGDIYHNFDLSKLNDYTKNGMNTIRLPILWERLQTHLPCVNLNNKSCTDQKYLNQIFYYIDYLTAKNIYVILDLHNYLRYPAFSKDAISVSNKSASPNLNDLSRLWKNLAQRLGKNPKVIFAIMNEPHDLLDAPLNQDIVTINNAVIQAIRSTGAKNLILVSGTDWSHLRSWVFYWPKDNNYGVTNAVLFQNQLTDPLKNYAYDVHEYFSADSWADNPPHYQDVKVLTEWLRKTHQKAFVSEIGISNSDPRYIKAGYGFLQLLQQNSDVFIGWTAWADEPACYMDHYNTREKKGKEALNMVQAYIPNLLQNGRFNIPS